MGNLADCHNHTICSADGHEPLERMIGAAAQAGLAALCPTDHLDLIGHGGAVLESWDWTPVLAQFQRAKAACPKGLELLLGIELGGAPFFPEKARQLLGQVELDLVIGSIHNVRPELGGFDFIEPFYADEAACVRALDDYFASLLALSRMAEIDVIGHIPYVLRYMNRRDGNHITLDPWRERIRAILKNVIDRGAGIELNTNRAREPLAELWDPILTDYRDLGGQIVTLGSDAHLAGDLGRGIPEGAELLRQLGFRYYAVYHRHKPDFIPL